MLLIREAPATELVVATRILAHLGILPDGARVALRVGSDVVYLAGRGERAATMTPYDIAALHLADGAVLAGTQPDDAARYLDALRGAVGAHAAALTRDGTIVTTPDLVTLVEGLARAPWAEVEAEARGAGALVGAYPAGASGEGA